MTPTPLPGVPYQCAAQSDAEFAPIRCLSPSRDITLTLYRSSAFTDAIVADPAEQALTSPARLVFGSGQSATLTIPRTPGYAALSGMTFIVDDRTGCCTVYQTAKTSGSLS